MKDVQTALRTKGPRGGWLRALRIEKGLTLQVVADRLDVSPQAVHQFEKSEVAGTISLRQLSLVAAAIGGRVSYRVDADDGLREVSVAPMKEAESRDVSVPDRSVSDTPTSAATERSNRLGAGSVGPAAPLVHDYFENRPD